MYASMQARMQASMQIIDQASILRNVQEIMHANNRSQRYTGESLQVGDCGITFAKISEDEAGTWTCHMGPGNQVGLEVTDSFNVRVTGPLAANSKEIQTSIGDTATLYCHTANGMRPLDYCRFRTPRAVGMSIDATITEENAILNRYYFTPGRDLDYGDCSLTIRSVQQEDIGVWTCAALVHQDIAEARDTITVSIGGAPSSTRTLSQAGIAGMVIGLIGLLGSWLESCGSRDTSSSP
ncbi:hypothetical protein MSG28_001681 [Choristoneura fumiferana]|uniref:Uncharacterized protein n=1 Tax=Choristoneura fumiferana TaxID=7141 RepID=A0ACC0KV03_CHOFU|nr:hypothetical protein MSG28_001681 [Choristoneura fumiferana]